LCIIFKVRELAFKVAAPYQVKEPASQIEEPASQIEEPARTGVQRKKCFTKADFKCRQKKCCWVYEGSIVAHWMKN
jgi:hypothetical protein